MFYLFDCLKISWKIIITVKKVKLPNFSYFFYSLKLIMGNIIGGIDHKLHPDEVPAANQPSKFDPLYGFPNGRKEKVMKATEEEMYAAKIPLDRRDYCAHKLLEFLACRNKNYPWVVKCHHEKHHYLECQYNEFVDRTKDYEREKRLMKREKRIKSRAEA